MANGHEDAAGGISPAGRFSRMEAALERIEAKLDLTATHIELALLSTRVTVLEVVEQDRVSKAEAIKETVSVTANAVRMQADARFRTTQVTLAIMSIIVMVLGSVRIMDLMQSL